MNYITANATTREITRRKLDADDRIRLINRVFSKLKDNTPSWRLVNIGSELAYLALAISSFGDMQHTVDWTTENLGDQYEDQVIVRVFKCTFLPEDPVWAFIQL